MSIMNLLNLANLNESFERAKEVDTYWGEQMPMMAMEELAELQQAISKYERAKKKAIKELESKGYDDDDLYEEDFLDRTHDKWEDVLTEMADVFIACSALIHRYEIDPWFIESKIQEKLDKKYE